MGILPVLSIANVYDRRQISNPLSKAKSGAMSGEGFKKAEEFFKKHFVNK
jgi:hypothetical protein